MDRRTRLLVVGGLLASVVVAVGLAQLASDDPDGLEYVAEQQGFADSAEEHDLAGTPLADYGEGLTGNPALDTAIAGLIGVIVTFGVGWLVLVAVRRPRGPVDG